MSEYKLSYDGEQIDGLLDKVNQGCIVDSEYFEEWELKPTGEKYIAPANGWIYLYKGVKGSSEAVSMGKTLADDTYLALVRAFSGLGILEVSKGSEIIVHYTATGNTVRFGFLYAKGQEPKQ